MLINNSLLVDKFRKNHKFSFTRGVGTSKPHIVPGSTANTEDISLVSGQEHGLA